MGSAAETLSVTGTGTTAARYPVKRHSSKGSMVSAEDGQENSNSHDDSCCGHAEDLFTPSFDSSPMVM